MHLERRWLLLITNDYVQRLSWSLTIMYHLHMLKLLELQHSLFQACSAIQQQPDDYEHFPYRAMCAIFAIALCTHCDLFEWLKRLPHLYKLLLILRSKDVYRDGFLGLLIERDSIFVLNLKLNHS